MSIRQASTSRTKARQQAERRAAIRRRYLIGGGAALAAVAVLFGIYSRSSGGGGGSNGGGKDIGRFQVGSPAKGAVAPAIRLASSAGGQFDLQATTGKTVLLYFQEGVGCQPCWDQIRDLEKNQAKLRALGIDELVSITGNDLNAIRQKVADEHLRTTVLADPGLAVSETYHANDYGMMGNSADGHTFIVVGPGGRINWRADYGGPPNYTMYVPVNSLVADIRAGLGR